MNLTPDEIEKLKEAAGNTEKWNELCDEIKAARNGKYPPDWYEKIVKSGILKSKFKAIKIIYDD